MGGERQRDERFERRTAERYRGKSPKENWPRPRETGRDNKPRCAIPALFRIIKVFSGSEERTVSFDRAVVEKGESLPFRVRARRNAVCGGRRQRGGRGRGGSGNTYCIHTACVRSAVRPASDSPAGTHPPFSLPFFFLSLFFLRLSLSFVGNTGCGPLALALPRHPLPPRPTTPRLPPVNKLRSRTYLSFPAIVYTACSAAAARTPREDTGCFFPRDGPPNFSRISRGMVPNGSRGKFAGATYFRYYGPRTCNQFVNFQLPNSKSCKALAARGHLQKWTVSMDVLVILQIFFYTSRIHITYLN